MSFLLSAEPHSRLVLESHSNRLLAQFDTQLRVVADRYLDFFQERRSIEITYTNSLQKLHHKAATLDASFDSGVEPTTTRAAWDTVRDNLKREVNTQQAFVDILDNDVIKPLTRLKELHDETRRRIEKDLNGSVAQYAYLVESRISELQYTYLKKFHPNKRFGGRVSTLFRGRREDASPKLAMFDDDCRKALWSLSHFRSRRVEHLTDGYDCLEELVFTPTVKDVLVKYMDGMAIACAKYDTLAKSSRAEVENALAGTDTSNLKATFRQDLSFSIPPLTLYRNHRPGAYSNLIFGEPLVDVAINEDHVPKVMRLCIEEVEKRGLNTHNIYCLPHDFPEEVLQLRDGFENEDEKSFSFSSTDDITFVAMLLELFLWCLPEPLFRLSLRDYRQYRQNRARYTKDGFSLLRSKIRELNRVQKAALEALLRHLLGVASHSDKNAMSVNALAAQFSFPVLRGDDVLQDGINVKNMVMEDLIQNAHILFDERPSLSEPFLSPRVAETASTSTYVEGSLGASSRLDNRLSSSMESRFTSPTTLLSPLQGFPSSKTLRGVETSTQEQVISEGRGPNAVGTLANSTMAEVMSDRLASVAEWRLQVPRP